MIDPHEVKKIYASLAAWERDAEPDPGVTRTAHWILIGLTQVLMAGLTIVAVRLAGQGPCGWEVVLPNGVGLLVSVLLPWPFRVDRKRKSDTDTTR